MKAFLFATATFVFWSVVVADNPLVDFLPYDHQPVYCPPCPNSAIDENQACRKSTNSYESLTLWATTFDDAAEQSTTDRLFSPSTVVNKNWSPPYGADNLSFARGQYPFNTEASLAVTASDLFTNGTIAEPHTELSYKFDLITVGPLEGYGGQPWHDDWFYIEVDGIAHIKSSFCAIDNEVFLPQNMKGMDQATFQAMHPMRQCWPDQYPCDNFSYNCYALAKAGAPELFVTLYDVTTYGYTPYFHKLGGVIYKIAVTIPHEAEASTLKVKFVTRAGSAATGGYFMLDNLTMCMKLVPPVPLAARIGLFEIIIAGGIPSGLAVVWWGLGKDNTLQRAKGKEVQESGTVAHKPKPRAIGPSQMQKMQQQNKDKLAGAVDEVLGVVSSSSSRGSRKSFNSSVSTNRSPRRSGSRKGKRRGSSRSRKGSKDAGLHHRRRRSSSKGSRKRGSSRSRGGGGGGGGKRRSLGSRSSKTLKSSTPIFELSSRSSGGSRSGGRRASLDEDPRGL